MFLSIIIDLVIIIMVIHFTIANFVMGYNFHEPADKCVSEPNSCFTLMAANYLRKTKGAPMVMGSSESAPRVEGPVRKEGSDDLDLKAETSFAIETQTGKILYEKEPDKIFPIASITKLMTALVFLDNDPDWTKEITVLGWDVKNGGILNIGVGETVTVRDIFYVTLIASDNTAAMVLARSTGLNEVQFLKAMNKKAEELGMENSYFTDPTGLLRTNVSTAREVSYLAAAAFDQKEIARAAHMSSYEFITNGGRAATVKNTNQLLRGYYSNFPYEIEAGKTGYIDESGYNLVMLSKDEKGRDILAVVLGAPSNSDRFGGMKELLDWIFDSYEWPEKPQ